MKFNLETYEPKGGLVGFPKEVIKRMLECQVEQGNAEDVSVFEEMPRAGHSIGGFSWYRTTEEEDFWSDVIECQNFDVFFEKYPKEEKPSVYQKLNDRDGSTVKDIWTDIRYFANRLQDNIGAGHLGFANGVIADLTVSFERLYALDPERRKAVEGYIEKIENKL